MRSIPLAKANHHLRCLTLKLIDLFGHVCREQRGHLQPVRVCRHSQAMSSGRPVPPGPPTTRSGHLCFVECRRINTNTRCPSRWAVVTVKGTRTKPTCTAKVSEIFTAGAGRSARDENFGVGVGFQASFQAQAGVDGSFPVCCELCAVTCEAATVLFLLLFHTI